MGHYKTRSSLADKKFKMAIMRKNQLYNECRDLHKALGMSWKEAEREFIEHQTPIAQNFRRQFGAMEDYEQQNKPADFEFIDPAHTANDRAQMLSAYDPYLTTKQHADVVGEE